MKIVSNTGMTRMSHMESTRYPRLSLSILQLVAASFYAPISVAGTYDNYDRFGNYEEFANPIPRNPAPIGEMTPEPIQRNKPLQNSDSLYRGVDKQPLPKPYLSPAPAPAIPLNRNQAK